MQRTHLVRLRFRDNDLTESTCETNLRPDVSYAAALGFVGSWRGIVQALSSAVCTESDLFIRWTETQTGGAAPLSDAFRQGVFIFNTGAADLAVVRVPSINPATLETSGPYAGIHIDQSHPDVAAFITAIVDGLGGVQSCDPFTNDLTSIVVAFKEQY